VQLISDECNNNGYLADAKVQTDMLNSCPQNAGQTEKKDSYEIFENMAGCK
jgi:hypothetical protein